MEDNEMTVIIGVEAQGPGKAIISEAEPRTSQNARRTRRDMDQKIQRLEEHLDNSFISKDASNSGTLQANGNQEIPRIKELISRSGVGSSGVEFPRPEKLNLKPSQTVYCVSNHISKATISSPSASEQVPGLAASTSTDVLPHATSQDTQQVISLPVRSKTSTIFTTIPRNNIPKLDSASTPCLPVSFSSTSNINAVPDPGVSTPPATEITQSRTSSSNSALSFFRNLRSALKGKGKAKDKHRTLNFPLDFLKPSTASTSKSTYTTTTSQGRSNTHLPISSIFHGLRHGYKPARSPADGIVRMLPPPVVEIHKPSLSPSPILPPSSKVKRKRDLWKKFKIASSSSKNANSRASMTDLLDDEDTSNVLDLGHIPLPSPLLYETCSLSPPNPNPKYTVTIHLTHPGQKVEYEMDNMTGHLLIIIYTPHRGFSTISGVVGGGSSRPAAGGYDNYDDDCYGYETASRAGGIWIPHQFDWNGLRVRDWGAVSGLVVFQFPEYVRLGRGGGDGWGEREVMPPDMGEEVIELELDEDDLDSCVIKEGKWGEKGKGKEKAAPQVKMGSKRKEKGEDTSPDGGRLRGKPVSRYDLRQKL